MATFVALAAVFLLMLALGLLFACSSSLRSIVRELMPAHEQDLLLPAGNWYMPQNVLGNFRLTGLFHSQPDSLVASQAYRATLSQARLLAATILLGWSAGLVYVLAA